MHAVTLMPLRHIIWRSDGKRRLPASLYVAIACRSVIVRANLSVPIAVPEVARALALAVLLAGCELRETEDEVRPAEWYESHPSEREKMLAECMSSASHRDASPDCVNASRAENNAKNSTRWGTPKEDVRTEPLISR